MANVTLTDKQIRGLSPREAQFEIFDAKVHCLSIRVSQHGTKSFCLHYRAGSKSRRLTLGRYGVITLADARQKAREHLRAVAMGNDPANEKLQHRIGYEASLFQNVLDSYIANHLARNTRSAEERSALLRREFGAWANLPVQDIKRQHIDVLLDKIVKRGHRSAANHAYASIRHLLNWATQRGHIQFSPCTGMRAPAKVKSRERVLDDLEIGRIWHAAAKFGYPFGHIVQLLLLTAQRRSEVTRMRWSDLNLEASNWKIPSELNKSDRIHMVPLSPAAMQIIGALPRVHEVYVFPARGKDNPASGWSKWKSNLGDDVADWTLHDLRRTAATGMATLDVEPHIIERILNHSDAGVAGIYNRHKYLEAKRCGLEAWAEHVQRIVSAGPNLTGLDLQARRRDADANDG